MKTHYAYIHAFGSTNPTVFYVGKGFGRRAYDFVRSRNDRYKAAVASNSGDVLVGVIPCSSERAAYELEAGLLKCFLRMGTPLTNMVMYGKYKGTPPPPRETCEPVPLHVKQKANNVYVDYAIYK